jgi:serine/threonine protein kinase
MTLKREEMAQLSPLLDEALPLDEAGRREWLNNLRPEYQPLAEALRAALLSDPAENEKLEALPKLIRTRMPLEATASELAPGSRVGPYELIQLLGVGGMAEVWLAKRADGAFKRDVALKLPNCTRFREELAERFSRERDILASLEHPNIARFYDAGVSAEGLPYLSMEYVPGQPITAWCDAHKIGIQERVVLFFHVLEAVSYAHEKQVIHRDLKPSNILVTESGQVRLLDFGVAKLLAEDADRTQLTSIYGRALTPDYASPELLKGGTIDGRSDVYSLGVVLHELLSGARPYRLRGAASLGLLEQAFATVEVKKPSSQIDAREAAARSMSSASLARHLRGDLDVIVLKALDKNADERYSSAAAMAEDLKRHLQHRPIQARPAPLAYRVKKFIIRNRPFIAIGAAAAVTVLAVVGYALEHRPTTPPASSVFSPPPRSVAVLPFTNLSGDPTQEYFSDGISEELINALAHIESLQVIARTSSFSFKNQNVDIETIARKLNVAAILEGSIRRSGNTVRITAQLINTVNGFHIWSEDYDRDLENVLVVQSDIATSVAGQLKAKLLGDELAKIEAGGTRNPLAHDAYLRAEQMFPIADTESKFRTVVAAFDEAVRLDPGYAAAYAGRAVALTDILIASDSVEARESLREQARTSAERAAALAPDFGDAHSALWFVLALGFFDFRGAAPELDRALELEPGNAKIQQSYGLFNGWLGYFDRAVAAEREAIRLDPRSYRLRINLANVLFNARRYDEVKLALTEAQTINPAGKDIPDLRAGIMNALSESREAQALCASAKGMREHDRHECLALALHALGRSSEAEAELAVLKKIRGDSGAYQYAEIYSQWEQAPQALAWLEVAERLHDPGLQHLRVAWALDPLRREAAFQELEHRMNWPP